MKILKTLLYILLAVVLVLVLLGFAGPKSYDISRTKMIDAPTPVVFDYLKSLKKQNEWGPWSKQDPDMKVTYEGEDGTVGFISSWESDKVGKGKQEITSVQNNTVETDLTFYMPWGESHSTSYMHAAEAGGGTEVTWGMRGENDFIGRIFGVFMNMDKSVGPMFEEGLDSLKAMIESNTDKQYNGYTVSSVEWTETTYQAIRSTVQMDQISDFLGMSYGKIIEGISKAGMEMSGPPSGLYYTWDESTRTSDMAAAIPVGKATEVAGTESITVPTSKALTVDYYGAYEGLGEAHTAFDEYVKETGAKIKFPVVEVYLTDPTTEPDTAKWLTKIYYLLDQ